MSWVAHSPTVRLRVCVSACARNSVTDGASNGVHKYHKNVTPSIPCCLSRARTLSVALRYPFFALRPFTLDEMCSQHQACPSAVELIHSRLSARELPFPGGYLLRSVHTLYTSTDGHYHSWQKEKKD